MKVKNALRYLRGSAKAIAQSPSMATLRHIFRYAHRCVELSEARPPNFITVARPWMCYPVIEYLEQLVTPTSKVFEYGSGGSTVFFAQRAQELVSIEHEPVWHQQVLTELNNRRLKNFRYELIEPNVDSGSEPLRISDPLAYASADKLYMGRTFKKYVEAIDSYPDEYFDLVVIDGRARPSCIQHAHSKVRTGGTLLLDQSERRYYLSEASSLLDPAKWHVKRYMAPLPYSLHFTEAALFTKGPL